MTAAATYFGRAEICATVPACADLGDEGAQLPVCQRHLPEAGHRQLAMAHRCDTGVTGCGAGVARGIHECAWRGGRRMACCGPHMYVRRASMLS